MATRRASTPSDIEGEPAAKPDAGAGAATEAAGADIEAGPTEPEAVRGGVGQKLANDLGEARRDYCLALHQAWVDATQASWRAYAEFVGAQHRSSLDAGLRRTSAYHAWFRSIQEAGTGDGGRHLVGAAQDAYRRAIEEAARTEWSEWDQAQQAYRDAASEVNKAHAATTQDALKAYLERIKAVWGRADIASVDAAAITGLAQASSHAAQVAQALQWGQR
jgi:hypothetical protein